VWAVGRKALALFTAQRPYVMMSSDTKKEAAEWFLGVRSEDIILLGGRRSRSTMT
jgi:hypothetical protein